MEDRYPIIELIALLDDIFGSYDKQLAEKLESIRLTDEDVQEFENILGGARQILSELNDRLYSFESKVINYNEILEQLRSVLKKK